MLPKHILTRVYLVFLTVPCLSSASNSSDGKKNILFFLGLSTYSHRIVVWNLAVKLAEKGHSVTFLQPVKNKNPHPNITEMVPDGVQHVIPPDLIERRILFGKAGMYLLAYILPLLGTEMCSQFLNSSKNIEWVKSHQFDLVMIDALVNDCGYGLAWKWNAKTVVFSTTHVFDWFPDSFGFPDESATYPSIQFATDMPLGFFGRVKSALSYVFFYFNREYRTLARIDPMLREKLDMPDMPAVTDLAKNTSLVFLNTHYGEELPRSLPPYVVPIGGMHVSDVVKPLPQEMETFIKGAGDVGFIYVSFGSEADMAKASSKIRSIFFETFGKSKTRFLWRWHGERPKEMPKNVLTSSWVPQQDVLGHPKCKGFITHGGLLSMQEAVIHAVPMIVFPIFAEQDYNAERLQRTGRGIRIEIGSLTEPELETAISRLLTDPSLKTQMKLASIRFKDRPEKAMDTALWWVDYVFRHDDLSFLRPHAMSLTWYERRQLDVWAFIALAMLFLIYSMWKVTKKVLGLCFGKGETKLKTTKGKKRN